MDNPESHPTLSMSLLDRLDRLDRRAMSDGAVANLLVESTVWERPVENRNYRGDRARRHAKHNGDAVFLYPTPRTQLSLF